MLPTATATYDVDTLPHMTHVWRDTKITISDLDEIAGGGVCEINWEWSTFYYQEILTEKMHCCMYGTILGQALILNTLTACTKIQFPALHYSDIRYYQL